jgi:hypothetical protein
MRYLRRLLILSTLSLPLMVFGFTDSVWTGYVTDTHCGRNCQRTSDMKPDLKCIQLCVRKGSQYGLWAGKRVYLLEPQEQVAAFAAQNVEVKGTIVSGTIHVTSIKAVPLRLAGS